MDDTAFLLASSLPKDRLDRGCMASGRVGAGTIRSPAHALPPGSRSRGTLENAQAMACDESPRTTELSDRMGDELTLDLIEYHC
jgi:hypothetical protein